MNQHEEFTLQMEEPYLTALSISCESFAFLCALHHQVSDFGESQPASRMAKDLLGLLFVHKARASMAGIFNCCFSAVIANL